IARTWRDRKDPEGRLLLAWLLAPVFFLSFSGSKLPSYLLPCLPAAALLAARGLDSGLARWGAMVTLGGAAPYGCAAGGRELSRRTESSASGGLPPWAMVACIVLAAGAVAAALGRMNLAALATTAALVALTFALAPFESQLGSKGASANVSATSA